MDTGMEPAADDACKKRSCSSRGINWTVMIRANRRQTVGDELYTQLMSASYFSHRLLSIILHQSKRICVIYSGHRIASTAIVFKCIDRMSYPSPSLPVSIGAMSSFRVHVYGKVGIGL